jgi:hypothetical protein
VFLRSGDIYFDTIARRLNEILARPSGTIEVRLDQRVVVLHNLHQYTLIEASFAT